MNEMEILEAISELDRVLGSVATLIDDDIAKGVNLIDVSELKITGKFFSNHAKVLESYSIICDRLAYISKCGIRVRQILNATRDLMPTLQSKIRLHLEQVSKDLELSKEALLYVKAKYDAHLKFYNGVQYTLGSARFNEVLNV